jgi:hypothetical protein
MIYLIPTKKRAKIFSFMHLRNKNIFVVILLSNKTYYGQATRICRK